MSTPTEFPFTFRFRNSHAFANRCINCDRTVPARTTHVCAAFVDDRVLLSEESIPTGFCHCFGFFRGSDHCQCCGCEEHEATCDHTCDGDTCVSTHDSQGRLD